MKSFFKKVWQSKPSRLWLIIGNSIMLLFAIISIVITQNTLINNTLNTVLGAERRVVVSGDADQYQYFKPDYKSKEETLREANKLNEKIAGEGFVLLKNNDNVLPLKNKNNISVFGKNSVNLVYGGSGSGGSTSADTVGLYDSLKKAGFNVNNELEKFYRSSDSGSGRDRSPSMGTILSGLRIGETPIKAYPQNVKSSYDSFNDAAIVIISRIGGEGFDLPRTMVDRSGNKIEGARSKDSHYLELDQNETDLLKEVTDNFDNVIVVINSNSALELGFLDDPAHYAYSSKIKGAVWIGSPGNSGINALGKILNGEITPSGRTVDTYARDFSKDPTWNNFSNNLKADGNRYTQGGKGTDSYFVDYEEGIYVGYRYYETRGHTDNEGWYKNNVVYPFGYGLSYTDFKWEIESSSNVKIKDASDIVTIKVKVTNTGDVAGKDVVQLYHTSPYVDGQIEKSHVVLSDFAKTRELNPGESEVVELQVQAYDMASYDYNDANKNGFKGYELDAGVYELKVMRNAHDLFESVKYEIDQTIKIETDTKTKNKVENRFDDVSEGLDTVLSRSDWENTWPTMPTNEDREVSKEFLSKISYTHDDKKDKPWTTTKMPQHNMSEILSPIQLYDLIGKDYDDPMWDELLDYVTIDQMRNLIGTGNFNTSFISNIGKPKTIDPDGPSGFTNFMGDPSVYGTAFYASETVIGSTWSVDLAYQMGVMIGNEGIWGNQRGDKTPYSGWYAPAVNLHRSPFSGRNWEYYSEDSFLSGILGAHVVQGAKSKGVYTYVKHFAVNDQETNRSNNGLLTWIDEQAMREVYLRPFEIIVKVGGTTAMMSSFNRLGTVWAGGSYELLTEVLRNEWGFRGMVITDYSVLLKYMNADQMIRAGGDLNLTQDGKPSSTITATQISSMRKATKNILYTVANSNAMNGLGAGIQVKYKMPYWKVGLITFDMVLLGANIAWGYFTIRHAYKDKIIEE